ncbi:MAG: MgtE intracellular region [Firmicutes bacterium]|jgi:flagellar protein FlbB|nr:MgtE intracellular region [Bacillota bacterium]
MAANKIEQEKVNKKVVVEEFDQVEDEAEEEEEEKSSIFLRILKIGAIVFFILVFIIGGFFLGVYLRVFDVSQINDKLELYKYPIIGQYFDKPLTTKDENKEQGDTEKPDDPIVLPDPKAQTQAQDKTDTSSKLTEEEKKADASKPIVLDKAEIDKQLKLRQAEEKKRVSKLARLYGAMKPDKAMPILDALDDDMVIAILSKMEEDQVSKILPLFDTSKSARLTRIMYNGKPPVTQVR